MTLPRTATAAVLAALALLVAACAAPPTAAAPPELVVAAGNITADGPLQHVAEAWNAAHPDGPHVRVEALPQAADEQRRLLAVELGAGLPDLDVLDLDVIWTAEFADKGWLTALDDLRPALEHASLGAPLQTATWNGTVWAAPFTTNAGILYYRRDLVPTPPATWAELVTAGEEVHAAHPDIAPFVSDGAPGEGLVVQFLEGLWAEGGDLGLDGAHVRFDEPAAAKALAVLREDYRNGVFAPGWESMRLENARQTFQSGKAVFMRSWPYAYGLVDGQDPATRIAGRVGIAALPGFDGSGSTPVLGGENLAVSRFSRDPADAEAFVRFATTDRDVQRGLFRSDSVPPALASAYDDLPDGPMAGLLREVLPRARPRPVTPEWTGISEEAQQQVVAAVFGSGTPGRSAEALRQYLDAVGAKG